MGTPSPFGRTRNAQLVRVLQLLRHLDHGRWTLFALSRELSRSDRTIRRDLAAIEEAGLPLMTAKTDGTRVWWMGRRLTEVDG